MKILLDENLGWRLQRELPGHAGASVPLIGWAGLKNGDLLARADGVFQILITVDRGLPYQQELSRLNLALVGLRARSNRLADTRPFVPKGLALLPTLKPGTYTVVA